MSTTTARKTMTAAELKKNPTQCYRLIREITEGLASRGLTKIERNEDGKDVVKLVVGWGVGLKIPGVNQYHDLPSVVFGRCTEEQLCEIHARYA